MGITPPGRQHCQIYKKPQQLASQAFYLRSPECCGFVEVPPRFELGNDGFADHCLTTWLTRHNKIIKK